MASDETLEIQEQVGTPMALENAVADHEVEELLNSLQNTESKRPMYLAPNRKMSYTESVLATLLGVGLIGFALLMAFLKG